MLHGYAHRRKRTWIRFCLRLYIGMKGSTSHEKKWNYPSKKKFRKERELDLWCIGWLFFEHVHYSVRNCEGDRCSTKQTNIMKSYMWTMEPDYNNFFSFLLRSDAWIRARMHTFHLDYGQYCRVQVWTNSHCEWKKGWKCKKKQLIWHRA